MIFVYLLSFFLLCLFSFTQIDLNLTLYNYWPINPILNFLKEIGYHYRPIATIIFLILVFSLYFSYLNFTKNTKMIRSFRPKFFGVFGKKLLVCLFLGTIAYPMFSHDIFNYIFNAKMILVYGINPHLHAALEFASDSWLRFMRNTHSPAPYGYIFTLISLLPVSLGLPNFTLSLWLTKLLISIFFVLEVFIFYKIAELNHPDHFLYRTLLLALNPLILIETFIVGHNDSLMMFFIFLSFYLLEINKSFKNKISGFISFIFSFSIKYATIVLTPILIFKNKIKDPYATSGILLLLILLTRPGQLNSWYLHWGVSFLFLSQNLKLIKLGVLLSIGGLLRYAPYIYYGHWNFPVTIQRWVLLLLPLIFLVPYEKIIKK